MESAGKVGVTVGLDTMRSPGIFTAVIQFILSGTIITGQTFLSLHLHLLE